MGLRCTVFGHRWGEAGTEREREESGGEVVVTSREVRTCRRCGAEDVLGETTEVTALDPHGGEPPAGDHAESARDAADADDEAARDPETDDGVILEEDEEPDTDRDPREWPGRPEREGVEERDGEPGPWPESAREQEAEPPEETFVGADAADDRDAREPVDDPASREQPDGPDDHTTGDHAPDEPTTDAGATDSLPERDADPGGRNVPEPDDDGIIEAGGDPDSDRDGEAPPSEEPSVEVDPGDDPGSEAAEPAGDDRVDIPRAESTPDADEPPADSGEPSDEGSASPPDEGGPGEPERDAEPGEEPAMGADATPRPDDDAEVLEATEPNEQSRLTAEEPVDPSEDLAGDPSGAGDPLDRVGSGSADSGRSRDMGEAGVADAVDDDAPSLDPTERPEDEEPAPEDVEFYCPECGFVDDSRWPSRRAGDVCPNCRRSYLSERQS